MTRPGLLAGGALAALTLLTLWPLLGADFVYWDDHALFLADPDVAGHHVYRLLTDLGRGGFFPLARLSLALDHLLFGFDALRSHAVNLVLHLINVGLVYVVARRHFRLAPASAAVVAGLFAVHPVNVEAVAWVSGGRKDLLCALFVLLAIASTTTIRTVLGGCLALGAKAMAVTLAPWLWLTGRRRAALWLLPPTVVAAALELTTQRTGLHVAQEGGTLVDGLLRAANGLGLSVSRFAWPRGLAVFYDRAVVGPDLIDAVALVGFAALVVTGDRRRWRALGWFALMIAPTLKLVPFGQDSVFNDRYLYLPGVGLLALAVQRAEFAWARRPRRAWAAAVPIAVLAALAHAQTRAWINQESLWVNVERQYPTSRKVAPNLALYYTNENRLAEAEPYARRAVAEDPGNVETRSNYGVLLSRLGRLDEARDVYREARAQAPRDARVLNNLGYVYLEMKEWGLAEEAFASALREAPDFANAREGLTKARAR